MNELKAAIELVRYAFGQAGLTAKAYGPYLPGRTDDAGLPYAAKELFPCALVRRLPGENGDAYITDEEVTTVDLRFYGNTIDEAQTLYEAMRRLHGANGVKTVNYFFDLISERLPGSDLPEQVGENERWDCVFCTYALQMATVAA